MGDEQSEALSALEAALKEAKSEGPRRSTPQDRMAAASARVSWLEAVLQALDQTRGQAKIRPVGERLDSCLQFVERVKKQITQHRRGNGKHSWTGFSRRRSWRKVCGIWRHCVPRPMHSPSRRWASTVQEMEVEDPAELTQLRAQVASLEAERQAVCESEASRQKKARTLTCVHQCFLVEDVPRVVQT